MPAFPQPGIRTLLFSTMAGVFACAASAQQSADGSKAADGSKTDTKPRIALIAVGDPPSPDYAIEGGKRKLGDTPESEYPPSLLYVKDKQQFKQVNLGLNVPADTIRHPGGPDLELFTDKQAAKEPYLKIPVPQVQEDLTVFLIRNPSTKSWRLNPIIRVFKNGLESFPMDSLRVMNFTRLPIRVEAMGKVFDLQSQATQLVQLPHAEQGILTYRAAALVNEQIVPLVDTATTYPADTRVNLVAYEADGKDKRQPVKVMLYTELPYKDPAKDKDKKDKDPAKPDSSASTGVGTR